MRSSSSSGAGGRAMGRTVAALNVVASPTRTGREAMERELLPVMLEAARELRGLL